VLLVGTATFKGTDCDPAGNATLARLPAKVNFRLGFRTPVSNVNCQNPDNKGQPVQGEDAQRGIFMKRNEATTAQLTFHVDHPFWDANEEDAPLRFDAFAAVAYNKWLAGADAGTASDAGADAASDGGPQTPAELSVTSEDLAGVDFTAFRAGGSTLPSRTCGPAKTASPGGLAYDPKGETFADFAAFSAHLQTTMAHLNADGLCAVKRN
jgi:hypothetical protein